MSFGPSSRGPVRRTAGEDVAWSRRPFSSSSSSSLSASALPAPIKGRRRVVILVDLDCFYAQCECVRLGFDALETPLVLMQWNSALAVTYPARDLGIKRGDSWAAVRQKSEGECLAVHVPVIVRAVPPETAVVPVGAAAAAATADASSEPSQQSVPDPGRDAMAGSFQGDEPEEDPSSGAAAAVVDLDRAGMQGYDAMFRLSPIQQLRAREKDLGVRYQDNQGKACIERYRIASARILETVSSFLSAKEGGGGVQVERASIDEFYVDVTEACAAAARLASQQQTLPEDWEQAIRETNIIGPRQPRDSDEDGAPADCDGVGIVQDSLYDEGSKFPLQYGCWLAWTLRQEVRSKLGFTMSAGVAPNKMLAKLSASYGKPNGQAVLYPEQVPWLLDRTPIGKCRNLGGKLGSRLRRLLPTGATETVGSIARNVSFHMLTGDECGVNVETARWLLDYVRGIDREAVQQETVVKTITSSKTLNSSPPLSECSEWFELLVKEIVTRVERDAQVHQRYPRFYHVHYLILGPSNRNKVRQQSSKGWKASFPSYSLSTANKIQDILSTILPTIAAREKSRSVRLQRIGLGAVEFLDRPTGGGARSFFAAKPVEASAAASRKEEGSDSALASHASAAAIGELAPLVGLSSTGESDEAMARRLQCAYDKMDAPQSTEPTTRRTEKSKLGESRISGATRQDRDVQKRLLDGDSDFELAKRLQAEYDREDRMVQALERRDKIEVRRGSKTRKIDSFFRRTSR